MILAWLSKGAGVIILAEKRGGVHCSCSCSWGGGGLGGWAFSVVLVLVLGPGGGRAEGKRG